MPITAYKICQYPTAETLGISYMKPSATIFEGSFENAKAILEATAEELGLYQSGWTLENFDEDYCLVIEEIYDEIMQDFVDRVKMTENSHVLDSVKAEAAEMLSSDDWFILSEMIADRRSHLELNTVEETISPQIAIVSDKYTVSAVTGEILSEDFDGVIISKGHFNDMVAIISNYYADYIKVGAMVIATAEKVQATIKISDDVSEVYVYRFAEVTE